MASTDTLQQAFENAKREFLDRLPQSQTNLRGEILATTSIDQVYDVTDKLQQGGKSPGMSKIGRFLELTRAYAAVIEVFVSSHPEVMALVWGSIKLILQLTANAQAGFDAVLNTTARIGDLLPDFAVVREIVRDSERLTRILQLFYRDILDFYSTAFELFSKPS